MVYFRLSILHRRLAYSPSVLRKPGLEQIRYSSLLLRTLALFTECGSPLCGTPDRWKWAVRQFQCDAFHDARDAVWNRVTCKFESTYAETFKDRNIRD